MIGAVVRLIIITGVSLTLTILAVFFVRQLGLQQGFAAPSHGWFKQSEWKVVAPSAQKLCNSEKVEIAADEILLLPVRPKDPDWILNCPDKDQKVELRQWLSRSPAKNILLKLQASETYNLDNLVDIVGSFDKEKNFGIASSAQKVSRALRKKAPQWLYAADSASLLRMQMFTSMWIETAMDFWPDFVITGDEDARSAQLSPRFVQELERRQKRVIWANEKTKPEFPVHGILTSR